MPRAERGRWRELKKAGPGGMGGEGRHFRRDRFHRPPSSVGPLSLLPPSLAEFQLHQHFCPLIGCLLVWLAQRAGAASENPFLDHT